MSGFHPLGNVSRMSISDGVAVMADVDPGGSSGSSLEESDESSESATQVCRPRIEQVYRIDAAKAPLTRHIVEP